MMKVAYSFMAAFSLSFLVCFGKKFEWSGKTIFNVGSLFCLLLVKAAVIILMSIYYPYGS